MARDQRNALFVLVGALLFVFAVTISLGVISAESYEGVTREHCKQYEIVPEEHLDRVPDGCVAQYFEAKK